MPEAPICDYEGSDYQTSFWERGGREYEDRAEGIALGRLLPRSGHVLLEIGAGAGRNTSRYSGFEQVVLLDYSRTQLQQAQARLGASSRYIYVAADAYRLPFQEGIFDAATMIRVLHHMADAPSSLEQVRQVTAQGAIFILEFANKRNLKAVLRYMLHQQAWSPFSREPVEFAKLNFDFHPASVFGWLRDLGFEVERVLTVSHFRERILKRAVPVAVLVAMDAALQRTGAWWQLTPSVFVRSRRGSVGSLPPRHADVTPASLFKCPECGNRPLKEAEHQMECGNCGRAWAREDGIYDFREPST